MSSVSRESTVAVHSCAVILHFFAVMYAQQPGGAFCCCFCAAVTCALSVSTLLLDAGLAALRQLPVVR